MLVARNVGYLLVSDSEVSPRSLIMDSLIIFGAKYLFAIVLVGAIAPLFWLPPKDRRIYVVLAAISGILAFSLTKGVGAIYFDPRPFTHGIHSLIPHEADNGFPSDHTALSFTAAIVGLSASRPLGIGLVGFASLVGLCRVLSGVHNPLDVVAGAVIGLISVSIGLLVSTPIARTLRV